MILSLGTITLAAQIPAFPGAEGYGSHTPGGRGGEVVFVTNLNDSGPGSLREAVSAGHRIVVFRVGGTIELESPLGIRHPYITIAGQTAPGGGICLKNYPLGVTRTHDVIVRYLRLRHGDESKYTGDALSVSSAYNVVIDHCSASWSVDETLSVTRADSVTIQWCFITESLNASVHTKGNHGYGGLVAYIEDGRISEHHNLWAHHRSRNPRPGSTENLDLPGLIYDFRNNVIYNWGSKCGYTTRATSKIKMNYIGNYLHEGPATASHVRLQAFDTDNSAIMEIYLDDNLINDYNTGWSMIRGSRYIKTAQPFDTPPMTTDSPDSALAKVLRHGGASLPKRDSVDIRMVESVLNGTGAIIDSQSEVGGWPLLQAGTPYVDADKDGMADDWETLNGLDPADKSDYNLDNDGDVYTNIEEFLNQTDPNTPQTGILDELLTAKPPLNPLLIQNYPNPFNNSTVLAFELPQKSIINLQIYDLNGRLVDTLKNGFYPAGVHNLTWNGNDQNGKIVSSGIYYAVLKTNSQRSVTKMMLLK
jgi:pectate lyase